MRLCGIAAFTGMLSLVGCGRYADFSLPPPPGPAPNVRPAFRVEAKALMEPAAAGWESVDVLNPSVVLHAGKLFNLYSAYDGKTWHTGVAESELSDGRVWKARARVLSPELGWEGNYIAANGAAISLKGELHYWYQAGSPPRLGLARSRDGHRWTKLAEPVMAGGPRGSWDERGVADPYVIEAGGALYLFYLGQNRARQQRLGLARSSDSGVTWTKLRSNPILEIGEEGAFDENGLGEPAVWQSHGRWWMLYTGRDRLENRKLGLAFSRDGARWERYTEAAVLSGAEQWNSRVLCDPTLLPAPGGVQRVWFGGGDRAHPAENIHGRIGYAELQMVPAP